MCHFRFIPSHHICALNWLTAALSNFFTAFLGHVSVMFNQFDDASIWLNALFTFDGFFERYALHSLYVQRANRQQCGFSALVHLYTRVFFLCNKAVTAYVCYSHWSRHKKTYTASRLHTKCHTLCISLAICAAHYTQILSVINKITFQPWCSIFSHFDLLFVAFDGVLQNLLHSESSTQFCFFSFVSVVQKHTTFRSLRIGMPCALCYAMPILL